MYNIHLNENKLNKFIRYFIAVGMVVSLIGLYFYFFRPFIFGQLFAVFRNYNETAKEVINYSRMVSVLLSPNVFGSFMAITLIACLNELFDDKISFSNKYYLIGTLLSIAGLVMSMSRGAWMFGVVGIITLIFYNRNKFSVGIKFIKIIVFVFFIGVFLLFLNPSLINIIGTRFGTILELGNESSYGRLTNWIDAFEPLTKNIFGYGLGVGGINLINYPEISNIIEIKVIDGFYVKTIIETGIIGILIFIIHIYLMVSGLNQLVKTTKNTYRKYYVIALSIYLGALAQSVGSNVFDFVSISPIIWLFIGIATNLSNKVRNINEIDQ
jgi:hypothetical protein